MTYTHTHHSTQNKKDNALENHPCYIHRYKYKKKFFRQTYIYLYARIYVYKAGPQQIRVYYTYPIFFSARPYKLAIPYIHDGGTRFMWRRTKSLLYTHILELTCANLGRGVIVFVNFPACTTILKPRIYILMIYKIFHVVVPGGFVLVCVAIPHRYVLFSICTYVRLNISFRSSRWVFRFRFVVA